MNTKIKRAVLVLTGGGLIAVAVAVYMYNKPHENIEKTKADFTLTAMELAEAFQENEEAANTRYLGKILVVSGEVKLLGSSEDGSLSYSLFDPFNGVTCTLNAEYVRLNSSGISLIEEGSQVIFKGRCDGKLTDVRVSDCVLLELE